MNSYLFIQGKVTARLIDLSGQVIDQRSDHNTWTLVGKEYVIGRISADDAGESIRKDRIWYLGVGSGSTTSTTNVLGLVSPLKVTETSYLKELDRPPEFDTDAVKYYARYRAVFDIDELSFSGPVTITEYGLFTDGHPSAGWAVGSRPTTTEEGCKFPVAYAVLEPITKPSGSIRLEVIWEVRF